MDKLHKSINAQKSSKAKLQQAQNVRSSSLLTDFCTVFMLNYNQWVDLEELTLWKRELYATVRRSYDTLVNAVVNTPNYDFEEGEEHELYTVRLQLICWKYPASTST